MKPEQKKVGFWYSESEPDLPKPVPNVITAERACLSRQLYRGWKQTLRLFIISGAGLRVVFVAVTTVLPSSVG